MEDFRETVRSESVVSRSRSFTLLERHIEVATGEIQTWTVLHKPDSVAVVAVDEEGYITLVEEYFAALNRRGLTLPKGQIETAETPEDAARRELAEEAGIHADKLELLGQLSVSPSYLTQQTTLYLATGLTPVKSIGDERQHLVPKRMLLHDAIQACLTGTIADARTVSGILLAHYREVWT